MNKWLKLVCLLLAMVLMLSLFGCGKKDKKAATIDVSPYLGTWQGSDHDGENVVHYLIFDANGYWNVYMRYSTLTRAIQQLPNQLVSFKVFRELQQSSHTGCYYEYVVGTDYVNSFRIGEDGMMYSDDYEDIKFLKLYDDYGEPNEIVEGEARDLFDRALMQVHS